jgi:3-methyladenine DNA glycosylase AlkD
MNVNEVMRELERLGTEQNRKTYRRHGADGALFGVSFAHLNTLQKRIKRDQELAEALWATGNADARTLAAMVADPARFTMETLDAWVGDVRYPVLVDLLVKHVASGTPFARKLMERWTASSDEWIGRAGWCLAGQLAASDAPLPDALFEERVETIEASIHRAKNRTREAMNGALIDIGSRNGALRDKAIAAARRIGKVDVDHGDTSCKTPEAAAYIEKIWIRKSPADRGAASAQPARGKAPAPRAERAPAARAEPKPPAKAAKTSEKKNTAASAKASSRGAATRRG